MSVENMAWLLQSFDAVRVQLQAPWLAGQSQEARLEELGLGCALSPFSQPPWLCF